MSSCADILVWATGVSWHFSLGLPKGRAELSEAFLSHGTSLHAPSSHQLWVVLRCLSSQVLQELVGDKSLERFRVEYEKLHRALRKSHGACWDVERVVSACAVAGFDPQQLQAAPAPDAHTQIARFG